MTNGFPAAFIFIAGAGLIPFFKGRFSTIYLLSLPLMAFINLFYLPAGSSGQIHFLEYTLILNRVDRLSLAFGYIFILITFISVIYSLHVKNRIQQVASFCYAGCAMGITFAGDLLTLYFFWELMAVASTLLILANRNRSAGKAAFRYFMWHFFGGVCLLAGIILYVSNRGTPAFSYIGLSDLSTALILTGFCLNAAVFPFHTWLPDAYPKATITGTVLMSALTTKSAVYILARTFPGSDILLWAGAFMACFPIFYAVLANDMRRVLSYSLISQGGFMICGIGVGSALAINGAVAHALCCIIYQALLFMSMGAVMQMTGRIRATDLGGLFRCMPFTALCCIIGAASIAAFPLFSGFISKSLTVSAVAEQHQPFIWLLLRIASAGVCLHAGIKVPWMVFFGHDRGIVTKEPPFNMRLAMGMAAFFCIFLGLFPGALYAILPFPVTYQPYTFFHVLGILELLMFGALAFFFLIRSGFYPAEQRAVNLDMDWFFRILGRGFITFCRHPLQTLAKSFNQSVSKLTAGLKQSPHGSIRIENGVDDFFHQLITGVPHRLICWLKPFNTESRELSWNVIYIILPFIVLLGAIFLFGI